MPPRLGIGVVTYNRRDVAIETVDRVLRHTQCRYDFIVADDGSADGTPALLRSKGVPVIVGRNMGIAWNKNRAIFYLLAVRGCDVAILLEDDSRPEVDSWEHDWILAALQYGHVNLAGAWMRHTFISGAGTAADPIWGANVTAQCSAFSREAIAFVGYMDTRFKGYGFEHVEHSFRLLRAGYGGKIVIENGQQRNLHVLLNGGIRVLPGPSHGNPEEIERNEKLCGEIMFGPIFRPAWQTEAEMQQLRDELRGARL
jgi:glycosyltransferase involved in cell wall biosynthesis